MRPWRLQSIVWVAWTARTSTRPTCGVSKSGLNAFMRHVASRWGREGITANCVAPGFTLTPEMRQSGQLNQQMLDGVMSRIPGRRCAATGRVQRMPRLPIRAGAISVSGCCGRP